MILFILIVIGLSLLTKASRKFYDAILETYARVVMQFIMLSSCNIMKSRHLLKKKYKCDQ